MALKKAEAPKTAPGGFEQGDTEVVTKAEPSVATPAAEAAAATAATKAIDKASTTSIAAHRGKMVTVLQDLKDALPPLDFGVLPRLVGSNGQVMDGDKKLMGGSIVVQLVSWNDEFVVSPGSDAAEAKEHVRYSRDGITIESTGESVPAYLQQLRDVGGYEKANVKQYCQLVGILISSEKPSEHSGGMVQVSLSPQSRKTFEGYRLQESVKLHMGQRKAEGVEIVKLTAEVKTQNGNTFTLLKPTEAPAQLAAAA